MLEAASTSSNPSSTKNPQGVQVGSMKGVRPDVNELSARIAARFVQRRDVKAVQSPKGAYRPLDDSPWTQEDVIRHLNGEVTYGHYLLSTDNKTRIVAFDIDFDKTATWEGYELRKVFGSDHPARPYMNTQMRGLADGFASVLKRKNPELLVLTTFSGSKGLHVYGCFDKAVSAAFAISIGTNVLDYFGCFYASKGGNFWKHNSQYPDLEVELFPKQATIGKDGYGNLLRLPCGVNQKSGRRGFFYRWDTPQEQVISDDPLTAMRQGSIRASA